MKCLTEKEIEQIKKQAQIDLLEWLYKSNKMRIHDIIANHIHALKLTMGE